MRIPSSDLPRNQSLPLFNPHVASFACTFEAARVPLLDAQADQWFREARALVSPERIDEPDYSRVVQLTRMAADRRHWKAMLNLASLYLAKRDPLHGVEDAIQLVEEGMRLGVPAAYDRMGTYHMNGTGVSPDATRAYAFWQKAAEMGSPQAMAYLGERLRAGMDGALPGYWANIPVATRMLECSLAQGHGPAAYYLHFLHREPRAPDGTVNGERTKETKARAVKTLHEGVRLGCGNCARNLWLEFLAPSDLANALVPSIDEARGERYRVLSDEIDFNPDSRFPNLDKVVPLPPADLPPWNGDRDTLLAAAMGVSRPLVKPITSSAVPQTGRHFLDGRYALRRTSIVTGEVIAPIAGYWRPIVPGSSDHCRAVVETVPPGLYEKGELFQTFREADRIAGGEISGVSWEYYLTVPCDFGSVNPRGVPGQTREVQESDLFSSGISIEVCPFTGTWQPWVHTDHPLQSTINQVWRQVWLVVGQSFPQLLQEWLIPVEASEVTWHLVEAPGLGLV